MKPRTESGWARLSAIGLVAFVALIAAAGVAGKPPPPPPSASFIAISVPEITVPPATPSPTPASMGIPTVPVVVAIPDVLRLRHRIMGEDGIFGLPGWPWRADDPTPKPFATPKPRAAPGMAPRLH